jgi:hypothetical protein
MPQAVEGCLRYPKVFSVQPPFDQSAANGSCRKIAKNAQQPLGFERGFWRRQSGWFAPMPKTSVFERLSSVKNTYWILLYAAKKLFL